MKALLPAEPPPPFDVELEYQRVSDRREFQRNLALTLAAHFLLLLIFAIVAKLQPKKVTEQIVWLDGGLAGGGDAGATQVETPEPEPEPEPPSPEPDPLPPPPPPPPKVEPAELPLATPRPATPQPATPQPATPKPATPKPATPKPATPKPATPKPTPKASPKPTPKKATPKPGTPKPAASPSAAKARATPGADAAKSNEKKEGGDSAATAKGGATGPSSGPGKGKGTEGSGPGAGKPSDFGWYFATLRDKYYAVWAPPTVPDGANLVVTLKIKVKRDGTVLGYELVQPSGNSMMDGSVLEAARQVTQIDALPQGLGREDVLEIPVRFKPE